MELKGSVALKQEKKNSASDSEKDTLLCGVIIIFYTVKLHFICVLTVNYSCLLIFLYIFFICVLFSFFPFQRMTSN